MVYPIPRSMMNKFAFYLEMYDDKRVSDKARFALLEIGTKEFMRKNNLEKKLPFTSAAVWQYINLRG
jgi:hypothetical protein